MWDMVIHFPGIYITKINVGNGYTFSRNIYY